MRFVGLTGFALFNSPVLGAETNKRLGEIFPAAALSLGSVAPALVPSDMESLRQVAEVFSAASSFRQRAQSLAPPRRFPARIAQKVLFLNESKMKDRR
jgi:hypothetical protein